MICYAEIFVITVSISFSVDQRPSNIISSVARKFGMSHLLPTDATVIYPTGQHEHHVESEFSKPQLHQQQQQNNNNLHCQLVHNKIQEHQSHNHTPYQKQRAYQEQKKSLPTSIKMETSSSDNCTSMPVSINSRIGKFYHL